MDRQSTYKMQRGIPTSSKEVNLKLKAHVAKPDRLFLATPGGSAQSNHLTRRSKATCEPLAFVEVPKQDPSPHRIRREKVATKRSWL
jgi:hypothetical protein